MAITVIGLFSQSASTSGALDALRKIGCEEDNIHIFGGAGKMSDPQACEKALAGMGVPSADAAPLAAALEKGARILAIRLEDDKAEGALRLLEQHGAGGVDQYPFQGEDGKKGQILHEAKETLEVGKEKVVRGGVQARSRVTGKPVEASVELTEEKVEVKRYAADRPLSPEEADKAFEERDVEMTETAEEATVRKAARLIGEVEVSKTASTHKETIKDTVRESKVEAEPLRTRRDDERH
jgi:stress response protein YsnF